MEPKIDPNTGWPTRESEIEMMTSPNEWPTWPMLPVKKRKPQGGSLEVGYLAETKMDEPMKPIVYLNSIFQATENDKTIEYESFEALLDAGWVVD